MEKSGEILENCGTDLENSSNVPTVVILLHLLHDILGICS